MKKLRKVRRYDSGGKVSDSEDTGSARARADAVSVEQGFRDYGVPKYERDRRTGLKRPVGGGSGIGKAVDIHDPEPTVGPLIRIYGKGGVVKQPWKRW